MTENNIIDFYENQNANLLLAKYRDIIREINSTLHNENNSLPKRTAADKLIDIATCVNTIMDFDPELTRIDINKKKDNSPEINYIVEKEITNHFPKWVNKSKIILNNDKNTRSTWYYVIENCTPTILKFFIDNVIPHQHQLYYNDKDIMIPFNVFNDDKPTTVLIACYTKCVRHKSPTKIGNCYTFSYISYHQVYSKNTVMEELLKESKDNERDLDELKLMDDKIQ